jgi:hypothetical protein
VPPPPRDRRIGPGGWDSPCGMPLRTYLRAIGEHQTEEREGQRICDAAHHLGRRAFVETREVRPDAPGHEDFEPFGIGRYPYDRDRGLLGSGKFQGVNRHDGRQLRLRRVPWTRRPTLQCRPRGR